MIRFLLLLLFMATAWALLTKDCTADACYGGYCITSASCAGLDCACIDRQCTSLSGG